MSSFSLQGDLQLAQCWELRFTKTSRLRVSVSILFSCYTDIIVKSGSDQLLSKQCMRAMTSSRCIGFATSLIRITVHSKSAVELCDMFFCECTSLQSVAFSASSRLERIRAFALSMTDIVAIPDGVVKSVRNAFLLATTFGISPSVPHRSLNACAPGRSAGRSLSS